MNKINPIDAKIALEMSKQLEKDIGIIYKRLEAMKNTSNVINGILEGKLTAIKREEEK